jgi:dehydrodolichyl diphosphate syntase complex subunit NUS1
MPRRARELDIYRQDAKASHSLLTPEERERLLKVGQQRGSNSRRLTISQPYLPSPPSRSPSRRSKKGAASNIRLEEPKSRSRLGVRKFLRNQFHAFVYAIVHAIFSVYIRFRQAYHAVKDRILSILYYHHRSPELIQKDVKSLARLPEHLSIILKYEKGGRNGAGLEALVNEVAEIAAWCACIGIPMLSVYESTGS